MGGGGMKTNIITIIIHLQVFKKVNMTGCGFVEEIIPGSILFMKTKGRELWDLNFDEIAY